MRNLIVLVICVLSFWACHATNVRWNDIEHWDNPGMEQTLFKEFNGMYALLVQLFVEDVSSVDVKVNISCQHWVTAQNWFVMNKGDMVNDATTRFQEEDKYLIRHEMGDGANIDNGTFYMENNTSLYLAFVCSDIPYGVSQPPYVYGWIELEVNNEGNIVINSSAYDLDGGPMIVGGGAWEGDIPEPSGGILFLLGAAALGLRRRSQDLL